VCGSHNFLIVPRGCEKAFDKVAHQLLLQKLKLYKVNPVIINGITSLLCFRKQRVRLNGFFSEPTEVITGIPQGTILGPIGVLFIIYINDIPDMCKQFANVYLFADDAKLSRHILSDEGHYSIQSGLGHMCLTRMVG